MVRGSRASDCNAAWSWVCAWVICSIAAGRIGVLQVADLGLKLGLEGLPVSGGVLHGLLRGAVERQLLIQIGAHIREARTAV